MPIGYEPTREPLLKRMFFGNSNHTEREEKVLEYIIHRMSKGTRLHDVMQEDYVRRNCSTSSSSFGWEDKALDKGLRHGTARVGYWVTRHRPAPCLRKGRGR